MNGKLFKRRIFSFRKFRWDRLQVSGPHANKNVIYPRLIARGNKNKSRTLCRKGLNTSSGKACLSDGVSGGWMIAPQGWGRSDGSGKNCLAFAFPVHRYNLPAQHEKPSKFPKRPDSRHGGRRRRAVVTLQLAARRPAQRPFVYSNECGPESNTRVRHP